MIIGFLTLGIGLVLGAVAVAAATVAWFVLPLVATVKASNGDGPSNHLFAGRSSSTSELVR